jgi:hypothetical protein
MAPDFVLHRYLAGLPSLPLWVHAWYDDLPQQALSSGTGAIAGARCKV